MKLFSVISIVLISGLAQAGAVIANSGLKIESKDLVETFTGEKSTIEGVKVVLVDNKSAQGDFCTKVLGMDAGKFSSLWAKKSFRDGVPAPKMKNSDAEVIDFVKSTPGALGYVGGAASGDVKEVSKF